MTEHNSGPSLTAIVPGVGISIGRETCYREHLLIRLMHIKYCITGTIWASQ